MSSVSKNYDPKAMRALAHPVRMALLELLGVVETVTATRASEVLGESPANCAFHLRTLAKYGFVREAGGGRGRERPWTAVHRSPIISAADQEDPQAALAADALGHAYLDRWLDRVRHAFAAPPREPDLERAQQWSRGDRFLTPDEAEQVNREVRQIVDRNLAPMDPNFGSTCDRIDGADAVLAGLRERVRQGRPQPEPTWPDVEGPQVVALSRQDPKTHMVSLIMDVTTANIAMFAVAAYAGNLEAHAREVTHMRDELPEHTYDSGNRRAVATRETRIATRLRAVERAYKIAIERDNEATTSEQGH